MSRNSISIIFFSVILSVAPDKTSQYIFSSLDLFLLYSINFLGKILCNSFNNFLNLFYNEDFLNCRLNTFNKFL